MALHTEVPQMTFDPQHIQKLKNEQQKGLNSCQKKIEQWEKFKADYEKLHKRLTTLADKVSHDVNVPIGNVAFMPGQMIHTNEILVLLGDNWFVERSAKQAAEIVDRRIKQCNNMLEKLSQENQQFEDWLKYTNEIAAESSELVEICEKYDPEEEKLWQEKHKESIKRSHQKKSEENQSQETNDHGCFTTEEAFARLEALEKQEEIEQELLSSENLDIKKDKEILEQELSTDPVCKEDVLLNKKINDSKTAATESSSKQKKVRRVQWLDQTNLRQTEESDESVSPLVIKFTHTDPRKEEQLSDEEVNVDQLSDEPTPIIKSPTDIYIHYAHYLQTMPKSILKKTVNANNGLIKPEQSEDKSQYWKSNPVTSLNPEQAISSVVVEKDPSSSATVTVPQHRPLSRFKARRKVINPSVPS